MNVNFQIERDGVQLGLVDAPKDRNKADRCKAQAYPPRGSKLDGETEAFCGEVGNLASFDYVTAKNFVRALPLPTGRLMS